MMTRQIRRTVGVSLAILFSVVWFAASVCAQTEKKGDPPGGKDAQPAVKPQNEQGGMMGGQEGMMGQMT